MEQKRNRTRTELGQTEVDQPAAAAPVANGTQPVDCSLSIQELIPRLEAFEASFVPYNRQAIKAKRAMKRARLVVSRESRLNQKILLQALISLLKNKPQSSPHDQPSLRSDIPGGDNIISYDDLLDFLSNAKAEDGRPRIQPRHGARSLYRQDTMPSIKPIVHRLNHALRAAVNIEFQGVGGLYYEVRSNTVDAPIPKPTKVLEFAKTFCSDLTGKCLTMKISATTEALRIDDKLRVRLKSPISGWLSLVVIAPDSSEYLIPSTASMKLHIKANKRYQLPIDADPLIDWKLQGLPGPHILMAFVSPAHERLLMPPELNVRIRHDRGVGFQVRDVRHISPDGFAFSYFEVIVRPRRNDPRGGSRCSAST